MTNNLPLSEVYKQMSLQQLYMLLRLKKMRPHSTENAGRIAEVEIAIDYLKKQQSM